MKVKRIVWLSLLFLISTGAIASIKQNVQVCLSVEGPDAFAAAFKSSDIFDFGTDTGAVTNGQRCVEHTYNHGPKNIKLYLYSKSGYYDAVVILNESCSYMYYRNDDAVTFASDYQGTSSPSQRWYFSLTPHAAHDWNAYAGKRQVYQLNCRQASA